MAQIRLDDSWDFYDEVVKPNADDFFNHSPNWRSAINFTSALFHMHEWVFALDKAVAEQSLNLVLTKPYDLWVHIEATLPTSAPFIRDVANAAKHVEIDRRPSTCMTHIANTYIQAGYGEGSYGMGRSGSPSVFMDEASGHVSLDACARDVLGFWANLTEAIRS